MKPFIQKNKKWFGYVLYAVLVAAVLLYFRFPSEALKDYLETKAAKSDSPFGLSIGQVSPSLPFGLKLLKTQVTQNAKPRAVLFRADALSVRPTIGALLRGKLKLCFQGLAYDGVLKGCTDFSENSLQPPFSTSMTFRDIRMDKYDLPRLIGRHLEGTLNGTVTYKGKNNVFIQGLGEADLRLTGGRLELLQPILSLDDIAFKEVSIKMVLRDGKINLARAELQGPNMRGTLSGIIHLRKDISDSRLDLRGTIEPFADFFKSLSGTRDTVRLFRQRLNRGGLSFIIRGTLKDPSIQFT